MAVIDNFARYSRPGRIERFWNVSYEVGPHEFAAYARDDVMLLQTFLRQIGLNLPDGTLRPVHPIPEVDGIFGPATHTWLEWYQGRKELSADGQVTRPPLGRSVGLKTGKPYVIFLLNEDFEALDSIWHSNLHTDRRTHPQLRAALDRNWPRGLPKSF
jgi:hypothetical protein